MTRKVPGSMSMRELRDRRAELEAQKEATRRELKVVNDLIAEKEQADEVERGRREVERRQAEAAGAQTVEPGGIDVRAKAGEES